MVRRGPPGTGIVATGSVLLGFSLIFAWFGGRTGWEALRGVDALLFAFAVASLGRERREDE